MPYIKHAINIEDLQKANRITPANIIQLQPNEVFVFGSNTAGRHGKGAASPALKWGAVYGKGVGRRQGTHAIPTKDDNLNTLSIDSISLFVQQFLAYADSNPDTRFLVTEIGCGLAGYSVSDIAPLFCSCVNMANISLPQRFWQHILEMSNNNVAAGLTEKEEAELSRLRLLQADTERWLSQREFDRMAELSKKAFQDIDFPF